MQTRAALGKARDRDGRKVANDIKSCTARRHAQSHGAGTGRGGVAMDRCIRWRTKQSRGKATQQLNKSSAVDTKVQSASSNMDRTARHTSNRARAGAHTHTLHHGRSLREI